MIPTKMPIPKQNTANINEVGFCFKYNLNPFDPFCSNTSKLEWENDDKESKERVFTSISVFVSFNIFFDDDDDEEKEDDDNDVEINKEADGINKGWINSVLVNDIGEDDKGGRLGEEGGGFIESIIFSSSSENKIMCRIHKAKVNNINEKDDKRKE